MAKKGPNSKAEAGNAKKAAVKAEKDKKANAAAAAAEDAKWAKGSKSTNKKDDAEAKKVLWKHDTYRSSVNERTIFRLLPLLRKLKLLSFW